MLAAYSQGFLLPPLAEQVVLVPDSYRVKLMQLNVYTIAGFIRPAQTTNDQ